MKTPVLIRRTWEHSLMLIVCLALLWDQAACGAGCELYTVKFRTKGASRAKCGHPEFLASTPPKYYLVQTDSDDWNHFGYELYRNVGSSLSYDYFKSHSTAYYPSNSYRDPLAQGCQPWLAPPDETCSGMLTIHANGQLECTATFSGPGCESSDPLCERNIQWLASPTMVTNSDSIITSGEYTYAFTNLDDGLVSYKHQTKYSVSQLTHEYTKDDLFSDTRKNLGDFNEWAPGYGSSASYITSNQVCVTLSEAELEFTLPDTERDVVYLLKVFGQLKIYGTNRAPEVIGSARLTGTGDPNNPPRCIVPVPIPELPVPDGEAVMTPLFAEVEIIPPSTPGKGGEAGAGPWVLCSTCQGGGSWGGMVGLRKPQASFSMGSAAGGIPAGVLTIWRPIASPALSTPAALSFSGAPDAEAITLDGALRQVKAPQALANIVSNSSSGYAIEFYLPEQVDPKSGDLYPVNGTPFVTWVVENPDAGGVTFNQLHVKEVRNGVTNIYAYAYTVETATWRVSLPGGLSRTESSQSFDSSAGEETLTELIKDAQENVVERTVTTYRTFDWGHAMTEQRKGAAGSEEVTTYAYYADAPHMVTNASLTPLRLVTYPDGRWEHYSPSIPARARKPLPN
jgi:hypothetical protein